MAITPLSLRFGNATSSLVQKNPWLLFSPSKVRESAVNDFVLALRQNKAEMRKVRKAGRNFSFDMKFWSARDRSAAFTLPKASWGNKSSLSMYRDVLGPCLKSSGPITLPEHDYKVLLSRLREFSLCIPHSVEPRETHGES